MVTGRVKHTIEGYEPHELSNLFVSFYPVGTTVRTDEYKTRPRIGVAGMYDSNGVLYELVNGKKSPVPGVNLWASMGEHVEPSGWTWRASWTFGIEPVNFTLRENETVDLSVVIMEDTPANNGELFRDVAQQVKKDSEQAAKSADKAVLESSDAKRSKEAAARSAKESSSSAYYSVNAANKATAAKIAAETASTQAINAAATATEATTVAQNAAATAAIAGILSGTGSPQGVVAAPVGSQYRDTAATNGAVIWVKASGTGKTGWVVQYGDTGWRQITPLNVTSGTVAIRRFGSTVLYRVSSIVVAAGSGNVALHDNTARLPPGFQGHVDSDTDFRLRPLSAVTPIHVVALWSRHALSLLSPSTRPTGPLIGTLRWETDDPWPTTLPGNPSQP